MRLVWAAFEAWYGEKCIKNGWEPVKLDEPP